MKKSSSIVRSAHQQAVLARRRAHAPYSKFKVGAALVTDEGDVIDGCNVENASYGATICAERVAILKAISTGQKNFTDIVIVTKAKVPAFPCALCLQMMAEFFKPDTRVWIADTEIIHKSFKFKELLPKPFGPAQLKPLRV